MNHKILRLFLLAFVTASPSFGQVIFNGSFETGQLSPWFQGGNYSDPAEHPENWNVTSSDAHSGLYSATDIGNIELRQNFAPVATSMIQDVSLWVRQPFGPALCSMYFYYSDSTSQFNRMDTQTTGWEFFDLTSRLAPNKLLAGISIYGYSYGSPGRTLIDDVNVTLVPEPSAAPLLGSFAAIAVLFRLRCRRCSRPKSLRQQPLPLEF